MARSPIKWPGGKGSSLQFLYLLVPEAQIAYENNTLFVKGFNMKKDKKSDQKIVSVYYATSSNLTRLEEIIETRLSEGWELRGDTYPVEAFSSYIQQLIRYEND